MIRTRVAIPLDPAVQALSRALREDHLLADVQIMSVCGEPDVRLVTCRQGGDIAVELLVSPVGSPGTDRWHAVQVRGEDRQVWRGPPRDASAREVVVFMEELLAGGAPRVPCDLLS